MITRSLQRPNHWGLSRAAFLLLLALLVPHRLFAPCSQNNCATGDVTIEITDNDDNPGTVFRWGQAIKLVAKPSCTVFDLTGAAPTCHWKVNDVAVAGTGLTVPYTIPTTASGVQTVKLCVDGIAAAGQPNAGQPICRTATSSFTVPKVEVKIQPDPVTATKSTTAKIRITPPPTAPISATLKLSNNILPGSLLPPSTFEDGTTTTTIIIQNGIANVGIKTNPLKKLLVADDELTTTVTISGVSRSNVKFFDIRNPITIRSVTRFNTPTAPTHAVVNGIANSTVGQITSISLVRINPQLPFTFTRVGPRGFSIDVDISTLPARRSVFIDIIATDDKGNSLIHLIIIIKP